MWNAFFFVGRRDCEVQQLQFHRFFWTLDPKVIVESLFIFVSFSLSQIASKGKNLSLSLSLIWIACLFSFKCWIALFTNTIHANQQFHFASLSVTYIQLFPLSSEHFLGISGSLYLSLFLLYFLGFLAGFETFSASY